MCSWGKFPSFSPEQTVLISFPVLKVPGVLIYNGQRTCAVLIPASLHLLMLVFKQLHNSTFSLYIDKKHALHILFIGTFMLALLLILNGIFLHTN